MNITEAITKMHPCDTCERIRSEKWCVNCEHNRAWQDNYKRDLNIDKVIKFMEATDAQDER